MRLLLLALPHALALRIAVTGAAGYLGAEVAHLASAQGHHVRAVVKDGQRTAHLSGCSEVRTVDDLCDLVEARGAAEGMDAVIHTASVFRKCGDMETELVRPNLLLAEQMVCACAAYGARLVFSSSMAAVRGAGQTPLRESYSAADWNTVSRRDGPNFEPYQFSKAESERRAWELTRRLGGEMVSLCPSMIFGPPRGGCRGFSVDMVQAWLDGESPVQSRLAVDVRDCAQAHVNAATLPSAAGQRYITSCEARVPAAECRDALRSSLLGMGLADAAARLSADEAFDGGAVPIGEREVLAAADMAELGVACRPATETLSDMVAALVPAGDSVDSRDAHGETALIRAAEAADRDEVRRLLAAGADARAESLSGWTALHGAAESGSVEVVSLLAEAGCDVSAVAGSGKTPLDIARQYNRAAAASALLELRARANVSGA